MLSKSNIRWRPLRTPNPFVNVTRKILGPISVIVCLIIQFTEYGFLFQVCFNLVEYFKEIANGEYGITASFIGSIFTVSSYRISNNKPICTAISQVILLPCSASKGLKNEKCCKWSFPDSYSPLQKTSNDM